jgi:uncharacterized protein YbbC (DUF1343 family)
MRNLIVFTLILSALLPLKSCFAQAKLQLVDSTAVTVGAEQMEVYLPVLQGKRIAIVGNQSSLVGDVHLVDTLLQYGVEIVKIFSPEHGFRGDHDAGAYVQSTVDEITGIAMVSLYGQKKKPDASDLQGIDLILFDLQDVGVRFYTYISTLSFMMEACALHDIPLIVLDRPNPNGFYIDGPVLQEGFSSFVGLHPVPVVYGLTIGEYGMMVNGEGWLPNGLQCKLQVIPVEGYTRNMIVKLPVRPSPNLPNWQSVYLYPSLCFFEGTIVSVGRGTDRPFQVFGHPDYFEGQFVFSPRSIPGAAANPKLLGQTCYGESLLGHAADYKSNPLRLNLEWLTTAYEHLSGKHAFFNNYFNTLAGQAELQQQIEQGFSMAHIRKSWQTEIEDYKKIRIKYLLYPDFEE